MESTKLSQIRTAIAALPDIKKRLKDVEERIKELQAAEQRLLIKCTKENYDVENLKQDSLSITLLKLAKIYDDRLAKEVQEALEAKLQYDKIVQSLGERKAEKATYEARIAALEKDKALYDAELISRELELKASLNSEATSEFNEYASEQAKLSEQIVEIKEALNAAKNVTDTVKAVLNYLEKAQDWATFDVWTRGGILTHFAKYGNIDNAQSLMNKLSIQLSSLEAELADVRMDQSFYVSQISGGTRTIDFWFDNIFTDLNVRETIRENISQVRDVSARVEYLVIKLNEKEEEIHNRLNVLDSKKEDLLIATEK